MPILADYYNENKDYYKGASLNDVAQDVFSRAEKPDGQTFEQWSEITGVNKELKTEQPPEPVRRNLGTAPQEDTTNPLLAIPRSGLVAASDIVGAGGGLLRHFGETSERKQQEIKDAFGTLLRDGAAKPQTTQPLRPEPEPTTLFGMAKKGMGYTVKKGGEGLKYLRDTEAAKWYSSVMAQQRLKEASSSKTKSPNPMYNLVGDIFNIGSDALKNLGESDISKWNADLKGNNTFRNEVTPQIQRLIKKGDDKSLKTALNLLEKGEGWVERSKLKETGMNKIADFGTGIHEATQKFSDYVRPVTREGSALRYVTGAIESVIPSLLIGTGVTVLTKNPQLGLASMFPQVYGSTYAAERAEGKSTTEARMTGVVNASLEVLSEGVPLGIITKKGGKFVTKTIKAGTAEGIQEFLNEAMQIAYAEGIIGDDTPPEEIGQRLIDAGIMGAIGGSGTSMMFDVASKLNKKQNIDPDKTDDDNNPDNPNSFQNSYKGKQAVEQKKAIIDTIIEADDIANFEKVLSSRVLDEADIKKIKKQAGPNLSSAIDEIIETGKKQSNFASMISESIETGTDINGVEFSQEKAETLIQMGTENGLLTETLLNELKTAYPQIAEVVDNLLQDMTQTEQAEQGEFVPRGEPDTAAQAVEVFEAQPSQSPAADSYQFFEDKGIVDLSENEKQFEKNPLDAESNTDYLDKYNAAYFDKYIKKANLTETTNELTVANQPSLVPEEQVATGQEVVEPSALPQTRNIETIKADIAQAEEGQTSALYRELADAMDATKEQGGKEVVKEISKPKQDTVQLTEQPIAKTKEEAPHKKHEVTLKRYLEEIELATPGKRIRTTDDKAYGPVEETWASQPSTFPEWFKNNGWSKAEAIKAIKKGLEGQEFKDTRSGKGQGSIWQAALDAAENERSQGLNDFSAYLEKNPESVANITAEEYQEVLAFNEARDTPNDKIIDAALVYRKDVQEELKKEFNKKTPIPKDKDFVEAPKETLISAEEQKEAKKLFKKEEQPIKAERRAIDTLEANKAETKYQEEISSYNAKLDELEKTGKWTDGKGTHTIDELKFPPVPEGVRDEWLDKKISETKRQKIGDMTKQDFIKAILTDDLTGLGNKRAYDRSKKKKVQISIDIDNLKTVNDRLGHAAGDELIVFFSKALIASEYNTADIARLGGDEFVIQTNDAENIDKHINKVYNYIKANELVFSGVQVKVSFSSGKGETYYEAEKRLQRDKTRRTINGERKLVPKAEGKGRVLNDGNRNIRGDDTGRNVRQESKRSIDNKREGLPGTKIAYDKKNAINPPKNRRVADLLRPNAAELIFAEKIKQYEAALQELENNIPEHGKDAFWTDENGNKLSIKDLILPKKEIVENTEVRDEFLDGLAAEEKATKLDQLSREELTELLYTDPLTGLKSKRAYEDSQKKKIQISLDADGLKYVNDVYGHEAGNDFLRSWAKALKEASGLDVKVINRVGGDEIIVQADNLKQAREAVKKTREYLDKHRLKLPTLDGSEKFMIIKFSHGIGTTLFEAEQKLRHEKIERFLSGDRVARGETPDIEGESYVEGIQEPTAGIKIEDVGEKLGGARKDIAKQIKSTIADDGIASHTLSEIWPKPKDLDNSFESAFAFVARAEIPSKPRVKSKVKRWAEKVKELRGLTEKLLSGTIDKKSLIEAVRRLGRTTYLEGFLDKVTIFEKIDKNLWDKIKRINLAAKAYTFDKDNNKIKSPYLSVNNKLYNYKESFEEVVTDIEKDLKQAVDKPKETIKFEVRGSIANGYFINKKGDVEYRNLKKFKTSKEAFEYRDNNITDLIEEWEKVKKRDNIHKADVRNKINRARTGKDHRGGKDVGAEEFREAFGFRGVEFGLWVKQGKNTKERQGMINAAYDALLDLSAILNIPPKAISFNGHLGLGFGSRGHGSAAAHFEPGKFVINLTKTKGAGSLAHEWFHALDNYFQKERGAGVSRENNYITYRPETVYKNIKTGMEITQRNYEFIKTNKEEWVRVEGVRPEVEIKFSELVKVLNGSDMYKRSRRIDAGKKNGYWSRIIERAARAFENYIIGEMAAADYNNDYLANVMQIENFQKNMERYPYLTTEELPPIKKAFDEIFSTLKTKKTDAGVKLFSTKPTKSQTITRKDIKQIFTRMENVAVGKDKDGNIWFKPVGREKITIHEVDHINGYINTSAGRIPVGSFLRTDIEVKTGGKGATADTETLWHELTHYLETNGILSKNNINTINEAIRESDGVSEPTAEHRADYLGSRLATWQKEKMSVRLVLKKVVNFITTIRDFLSKSQHQVRTVQDILGDIYSGKILKGKKEASGVNEFAQAISFSLKKAAKAVTDNPNFKKWFGDSKVLDEDGSPKIMYHGTDSNFTVFDLRRTEGDSFFFTDERNKAKLYGDKIVPVYLSLQNPLEYDYTGYDDGELHRDVIKYKAEGEYDGIIALNISDGEKVYNQYVAFNPTQIKSIYNTGAFDPSNPDIRYQMAGQEDTKQFQTKPDSTKEWAEEIMKTYAERQQKKDAWLMRERSVEEKAERPTLKKTTELAKRFNLFPSEAARAIITRHFNDAMWWVVDKNRPIATVQSFLDKVTDNINVFLKETQRPKRTAARIQTMWAEEIKPLIEKMAKYNINVEDLEAYKHALHAQEANNALKRSNAKLQVEKIIKVLEASKEKQKVDDIRKFTKGLKTPNEWFSALNDIITKYGSEKVLRKTITSWNDFSSKPSGMTNEEARDILQEYKGDKKIKELGQMVDSLNKNSLELLYNSGQIPLEEYEAILNKYDHYVPLYREGFDDRLFGAAKGLKPSGRAIKTRSGSTRNVVDIIAHSITNYEKAITIAEKAHSQRALLGLIQANPESDIISIGAVKKSSRHDANGNLRLYPDMFDVQPNEMRLMVDGEQYIVTVQTDNADAMLMMRTLKAEDSMTGPIINQLAKVNRFLAKINTTWSPEFIVSNFIRDIQTAGINIKDTGVKGKSMLGGARKAWGAIYAIERGNPKGTELEAYYERFKAAGGKIGWADVHSSVENLGKKIKTEISLAKGERPILKTIIAGGQLIEDMNTSIENGIRLHVFKLAVEQGKTDERAAQIASDLTVDFTKKGAAGPVINSLYLFANAGIQGSYRIFRAGAKSPAVRKHMAGIIGASFLIGVLNAFAGGVDDDGEDYYNKIDNYVRERNMIIMLPNTKGKYIKIPLPWGYNVFWNFGAEISRAFSQKNYDPLASAGRVASTFFNAFNPVAAGTLMQTLSPTIADPFVQIAENKNWFGGELMPGVNKFDRTPEPDSQRYWKSASSPSQWITSQLNDITGGDKVKAGKLDFSPETLDLFVDTIGGSAFKFIKDTFDIPIKAIHDEEIKMHKIPFVRKVFSEKSEWADSRIFYENINDVLVAKERLKAYRGTIEYPKLSKELRPQLSLTGFASDSERRLKQWRQRLKQAEIAGNKTAIKNINENIKRIYVTFNKVYNKNIKE